MCSVSLWPSVFFFFLTLQRTYRGLLKSWRRPTPGVNKKHSLCSTNKLILPKTMSPESHTVDLVFIFYASTTFPLVSPHRRRHTSTRRAAGLETWIDWWSSSTAWGATAPGWSGSSPPSWRKRNARPALRSPWPRWSAQSTPPPCRTGASLPRPPRSAIGWRCSWWREPSSDRCSSTCCRWERWCCFSLWSGSRCSSPVHLLGTFISIFGYWCFENCFNN